MKKLFAAAVLALFVISCEKKTDTVQNENNVQTDSTVIPETNEPIESSTQQSCYVGTSGKDSIFVSLEDNLGTFTGQMRYKNFEKDSSTGTLVGTQNGDTIKVTYTFAAEGLTSEREIYFLRKNGELIEGVGEYANDQYKDPKTIKYEGHVLKQADCNDFDKNFSGY